MRKESLDFLKTLLNTPTPSGYESTGQKIWCDYARQFADEVHTDAYGNAVAVLNPSGDPKIMVDGHIDEIGMIVKYIDDKGFIYVQRIGGVDPGLVRNKRVNIRTAKGVVRGVLGSTPIHLQDREKEAKVPKLHEVYIDIGAADGKAAKKLVSVGDPLTFVDEFEMLNANVAVSRGMDNRVGTWVAIEALRLAAGSKLNCCLCACSSVQEEVGLMGAAMQVENVKPDAAIVVDVTFATDTPGIDIKQYGQCGLGKGPAISIGRENHPIMVERLKKVAQKKKIAVQMEAFSVSGGTDALAIFTKRGGIPSVVCSVPNRYMHSTVEMIDLRDIQKAAELIAAFAADIRKGERFAVKV